MKPCFICTKKGSDLLKVNDPFIAAISVKKTQVCGSVECATLAFAIRYAFLHVDYPDRYFNIIESYSGPKYVLENLEKYFGITTKRVEDLCLRHSIVFKYPQQHADVIQDILKALGDRYAN